MTRRIVLNTLVWSITDHLCRRPVEDGGFCGGRIVSKVLPDRSPFSRCTRCGLDAPGHAEALCMCGETVHNGRKVGANAGLRCVKNELRTADCPDEIVVRFVEQLPASEKPKTSAKPNKYEASGDLFD